MSFLNYCECQTTKMKHKCGKPATYKVWVADYYNEPYATHSPKNLCLIHFNAYTKSREITYYKKAISLKERDDDNLSDKLSEEGW